jgi:hypothetical protein
MTFETDSIEIYYCKEFLEIIGPEPDYCGWSSPKGIAINLFHATAETLAHEINHTLRKNGAPSHQDEYFECLMYPYRLDTPKQWDIRLKEAILFNNYNSDW